MVLGVAAPAGADVAPPTLREPYNVFTVGDSYAAGEGAPQRDGVYDADGDSPNPREDWDTGLGQTTLAGVDTERCHRSPLSTSGVATGYLATDFPDILTTFKSVACSGGAIVGRRGTGPRRPRERQRKRQAATRRGPAQLFG